jgi:hypothetical protein
MEKDLRGKDINYFKSDLIALKKTSLVFMFYLDPSIIKKHFLNIIN